MISKSARLLFVYGTLQRGGIWHHLLAREDFVGCDTVTGALYLHPCGAYPVMFPGDSAVPGEVFRVEPAALERVARLEADEYTPRDVMTGAGRSVTVFVCEDDRFRIPSRALESFDPTRYHAAWHLTLNQRSSPTQENISRDRWLGATTTPGSAFTCRLSTKGREDLLESIRT